MKPCLTCGAPVARGSYCPAHLPRNGSSRQWRSKRARVLARDGHRCRYCGAPATQVDHVIPVAHGGADEVWNLVAACSSCNLRKGAR